MSTVITNGYATNKKNLLELFDSLEDLKETVSSRTEKIIYKEMSERFKDSFYDLVFEAENKNKLTPFSEVYNFLENLREEDFSSKVVLYPVENKTLLTIHTPFINKEEEELMGTEPCFKPYYYWNNAEEDETVSEEEWAQRKNDWDVVGSGHIEDYGFTFLLYSPRNTRYLTFDPNFKTKLFENFGSLNEFKYSLAHQSAANEFCSAATTTNYVHLFNDFVTLVQKDDSLVQEKLALLNHINSWDDVTEISRSKN